MVSRRKGEIWIPLDCIKSWKATAALKSNAPAIARNGCHLGRKGKAPGL